MGCAGVSPIGYRVTTQNVPMLEESGEVQAHAGMGFNHSEFIGACSPAKHLGIIASSYGSSLGISNEYGVGTYFTFKNGLKLEAYASAGKAYYADETSRESYGLATGSGRMTYTHSLVDFAYTKRNLQVNAGFKKRHSTISLSAKWTRAYYDHYKYLSESHSRESWNIPLRLDSYFYNSLENTNFNLLAIAPTYSYRGNFFFFQTQLVITQFVGQKRPFDPYYNFYSGIMLSTTLGFDINVLKPRSKKSKETNTGAEHFKL